MNRTRSMRTAAGGLVIGSLFTGYGGLDMGIVSAFGRGRVAWVADPEPHIAALLRARLPGVTNLGDVSQIEWDRLEPVDVLSAGWPCQDISSAGRRLGIEKGARSGLWRHVVTALAVLRPPLAVLENVAALRWRNGGLDVVLRNLHGIGYDCLWSSVRASDVGAAHRRERVFLLAFPHDRLAEAQALARRRTLRLIGGGSDWPRPEMTEPSTPAAEAQVHWGPYEAAILRWQQVIGRPAPHPTEPGRTGRPRLSSRFVEWLMGLPDGHVTGAGVALPRTAQLRALGNGVVPQQAAYAVTVLLDRLAAVDPAATGALGRAA